MENTSSVYKLTYWINTGIILFLAGISVFFKITGMTILVYLSLALIPVYIVNFWIIRKDYLTFYIGEVYTLILAFMAVCTVYAGTDCGFQLYSLSMIPVIFVIDYLAFKMKRPRVKPLLVSFCVVVLNISTTLYVTLHGPIYQVGRVPAMICLMANSASVFFFLIFYTSYLVNMNMRYEEKLEVMAHSDKLTGLSNRHYFIDYLSSLNDEALRNSWIAMLDIDFFKTVNDTYGHQCGDEVLVWVSEKMKTICSDCLLCRWGGEEFVVLSVNGAADARIMEDLRSFISHNKCDTAGNKLSLTVTVGVSARKDGEELLSWIQKADDLMYEGKNSGRNTVIFDSSLMEEQNG